MKCARSCSRRRWRCRESADKIPGYSRKVGPRVLQASGGFYKLSERTVRSGRTTDFAAAELYARKVRASIKME